MRHLNELNGEWVTAARRLSRQVLLDLTKASSGQLADLMEATDLDAPALYPVAWAGESVSKMRMDIAREYTERWHHQDQIREAKWTVASRVAAGETRCRRVHCDSDADL